MAANAAKPGCGPVIGAPPTLEWVGVDRLSVDERYQRATESDKSRRLIRRMVERWNWRLCQPLAVSRRTDGSLFVVDGHHRLEGARQRGDLPHLPCVVTAHNDHADEADTFVALNTQRQKLSQGDIFAASLAAGDPQAQRAFDLLTEAGLTLARHGNPVSWKPRQIFCGPRIAKAIAVDGEEAVRNSLVALAEAYPDRVVGNAATLFNALLLIYREDAKRTGFDPDLFIQALGSVDPSDWFDEGREARAGCPGMSVREGIAAAFMEQYDALRADLREAAE